MEYFQGSSDAQVSLLVCNKPDAPVLAIAESFGIDQALINRHGFYETNDLLDVLEKYGVDFIVLAGFLWLLPPYLVQEYSGRIVNIHPALLPKFGGKGMYGKHVHEAVVAAGETESGITIHQVDERYDEGQIVFQARCPVSADDTPADVARKVQQLEHRYYPEIIGQLLAGVKKGD